MSDRQWVYATRSEAEDVRDAIAIADGMPRKGRWVRPPSGKATIPDTYSEGAFGWSDQVVEVSEHPSNGTFAIRRRRRMQRHEGKRVRVRGGDVDIPTNATAEDRGAAWDPPTIAGAGDQPKERPKRKPRGGPVGRGR